MRDPIIEREGYFATEMRRRRIALGGSDGRCPICGCRPKTLHTHKVADEVTARLGYEYMTTCDSHYCRSQDVVRR